MFVPSFGVIIRAVLLVGALWWCKVMLERSRSDLARLRKSDDSAEKGVIVFLWAVTVGILIYVGNFLIWMVRSVLSAF